MELGDHVKSKRFILSAPETIHDISNGFSLPVLSLFVENLVFLFTYK